MKLSTILTATDRDGTGPQARSYLQKQSGTRTFDRIFRTARFKLGTVVSERCSVSKLFLSSSGMAATQSSGGSPFFLAPLVDHLQRPVDDGRRTQNRGSRTSPARHIPRRFYPNWVTGCLPSSSQYGGAVKPILVGDDHAASVSTGVTRDTFELTRRYRSAL